MTSWDEICGTCGDTSEESIHIIKRLILCGKLPMNLPKGLKCSWYGHRIPGKPQNISLGFPTITGATVLLNCWSKIFKRFYLFIFREKERKGERARERETWCTKDILIGCLSHTPNWGPGSQPRHVPWLGIELATIWFTGWHSIHWVPPARANPEFLTSVGHSLSSQSPGPRQKTLTGEHLSSGSLLANVEEEWRG